MLVYKSKRVPLLHLKCFATECLFINQKGSPFTFKMFCAFWALDIAPTWDVPVLFDKPVPYERSCTCSRIHLDSCLRFREHIVYLVKKQILCTDISSASFVSLQMSFLVLRFLLSRSFARDYLLMSQLQKSNFKNVESAQRRILRALFPNETWFTRRLTGTKQKFDSFWTPHYASERTFAVFWET